MRRVVEPPLSIGHHKLLLLLIHAVHLTVWSYRMACRESSDHMMLLIMILGPTPLAPSASFRMSLDPVIIFSGSGRSSLGPSLSRQDRAFLSRVPRPVASLAGHKSGIPIIALQSKD